jgi:hypothetical protein
MLPITARKGSDTPKTSTTVLTADADIVLPLEANATYDLIAMFQYTAALASGFSAQWTYPASAVGSFGISSRDTTTASASFSADATLGNNLTSLINAGGINANLGSVNIIGSFTTAGTAGNLTLTWAQSVSNATSTILKAGSYCKITRIG